MELVRNDLFINRELSSLAFNWRVLAETRDSALPLFERLKFLAICSSNLDEFFMVRVAGLRQQLTGGISEVSADGLQPAEQLTVIADRAHLLVTEQYRVWNEELRVGMAGAGLTLLEPEALTEEQVAAGKLHFLNQIFPALTPLAVDSGHPFPHLRNKSLNLALRLRRESRGRRRQPQGGAVLALVQVPSVLPRLVSVPSDKGRAFVLLEDLIARHVTELFPGFGVIEAACFRVTRNWDLAVDEEDSEDLLSSVQEELRKRDRGAAVRLEIASRASPELENELREALALETSEVYRCPGPLQLNDLAALTEFDSRPELRVEAHLPVVPKVFRDAEMAIDAFRTKDVLLHHPYESFEPVLRFIEEAAEDPNVLAIKQTLYRAGGDSRLVKALARAAENGKQVAVLMEIKARFDEANNIAWAHRLEQSGVHVVYGMVGLKTHAKVALVVRRESGGIRRFVHLSTGN